jgi:hypothetical protein
MTSRALIVPIVELKPHPPAYGELRLRRGSWDQLQASRAYREKTETVEAAKEPAMILDVEV